MTERIQDAPAGPSTDADRPTASERLLRSLEDRGVDRVFANLGTDHTPLLEAAARVRAEGEGASIPEFVVSPHEFAAMSAAHGAAVATGEPQAVLVHVDVGTQNLGAAMHNAHRGKAPVLVLAGLAPVAHEGQPGARDHVVHYVQDVFDQPGIVREYCRWVREYRPPTDPAELVDRGLERAAAVPAGPTYLAATREALETPVAASDVATGPPRRVRPAGADPAAVEAVAERVRAAEAPLVVTADLGAAPDADGSVAALVAFAEAAGAGVVEHSPWTLNFPRDHELHAGFDPTAAFEHADLVVLADADVPWVPDRGGPAADVVQIDADPTKATYPQWPFPVDETVAADPARTLAAVADRLDPADGEAGQSLWRSVAEERRAAAEAAVREARSAGRLTPAVLSSAVDTIVDDATTVVADAVTSSGTVLEHVTLTRPGSFHEKAGSGLGWAGGAGIGVKLARPDERVVSLMGDGAYLFAQPTTCAWMAVAHDAPTLSVIYDNRGWNAVEAATRREHPEGASVAAGVPESRFDTPLDFTAPATAVDSFTRSVDEVGELEATLSAAAAAVDDGRPAVVSVTVERPA